MPISLGLSVLLGFRWISRDSIGYKLFGSCTSKADFEIALKRDTSTLSTNSDEMRELASRYYEQLLSADEVSQNVLAMRGIVFGTTKPCVTDRMVQTLLCPFFL